MGKDNRTNAWGWISLVLAVTLIGAGFLYQREGGRLFGPQERPTVAGSQQEYEPKDQKGSSTVDAELAGKPLDSADFQDSIGDSGIASNSDSGLPLQPPEKRVTRSTPGTVNVRINAPRRDGRNGIWLYVDRKLVGYEYGSSFDFLAKALQLVPGKHTIEGCRLTLLPNVKRGDLPFPFQFESQQVDVEPGSEQSLTLELPEPEPAEGTNYGESGIEDLSEDALRNWLAKYDQITAAYDGDELVKAIESQKELKPRTSVVTLEIPDKYGSPREVDARQVYIIVEWLLQSYWGAADWPGSGGVGRDIRIDDLLTPSEREVRRQLQTLQTLVDQHKDRIKELNGLATMMEEAPK